MQPDPRRSEPFGRLPGGAGQPPTLFKKIVAVLVAGAVFVLALMASVVLFAVVLTVGALALAWFWWKTRAVRKRMRDKPPGGLVIEGEVIRERREPDEPPR